MRRAGGKQSQRALEQPRRRRRGDGARGRAADRGLRGRAATTVTTGPIPSFTSPPLVAHSIAMHNDECRRAGRFGDSCCAARHDARHDAWRRRDHGRDRLSANAACIAAAGGIIPLVALVTTRAPLSKERAASALWHSSRRLPQGCSGQCAWSSAELWSSAGHNTSHRLRFDRFVHDCSCTLCQPFVSESIGAGTADHIVLHLMSHQHILSNSRLRRRDVRET